MKEFNGKKFNKIKMPAVVLLAVLATLFIGFAFLVKPSVSLQSADAATSAGSLVAWYKFESASTVNVDAMGNYTLTMPPATAYDGEGSYEMELHHGTWTTDGYQFYNGTGGIGPYAYSADQSPIASYFNTSKSFTISALYHTGTAGGNTGDIFRTSSTYKNGVRLSHSWGTFKFEMINSGKRNISFSVKSNTWVRAFIYYDANTGTIGMKVYDLTNKGWLTGSSYYYNDSGEEITNNTGVYPTLYIPDYSLYRGSDEEDAFCIGNKLSYGGQYGVDGGFDGDGKKLADLRFYSGIIDSSEQSRIVWGDSSRNSSAQLKFSYRPFANQDVAKAQTSETELVKSNAGPVWNSDDFTTQFSECYTDENGNILNGVLYAPNYSYTNALKSSTDTTDTTIKNDWSDYIRNGMFSVSFRMFLVSGYVNGNNYPYYVVSTGSYANAFNISVNWGTVRIGLGDSNNGGYYLDFSNVFSAPSVGNWIRGYVTYSNDTFTGWVYNESTSKKITGVLYKDNGSTTNTLVSDNKMQGGSFGGYDYSFTIGGQSNFGNNTAMYVYNSTISRNYIKISRLDIYTGVLTESQISALNDIDDRLVKTEDAPTNFSAVSHYEFKDTSNLGYDTLGYNHLTNGGAATYDSTNGGLLLNSTNGDLTSKSYLYSKPLDGTVGAEAFDRFRGSMTVSFRARIRSVTDSTHTIVGSGTGEGFFIGVKNSGLEIHSGSELIWINDVFDDIPTWYRINISFNSTTAECIVQVIKQDEDKLSSFTETRTLTGKDFGGNFAHTLTIGGVVDTALTTLQGGTKCTYTDGSTYAPTLADLRIYTGVLTDEEKLVINQYDAAAFKIDSENSLVNARLETDFALNYWIKLTGGINPWFNINYNGRTLEGVGKTSSWISMPNGSGRGTKVTFTAMAIQDMNDAVNIVYGEFTYQGSSYTMNLGNWSRCSLCLRDYLEEIVTTYGESSDAGKTAIYALNLGAAAQRTVGHDTGDLANKNLTATQKAMTGWTSSSASADGHLKTNQIWEIVDEGSGNNEIIDTVAIAPEYDNNLGFVILIDTVTTGANYTVQLCDSTGAVLQTFSSDKGLQDRHVDVRKYFITGGLVSIDNLEEEYRVKIFVDGEQHYKSIRFNFLHFVSEYYNNRADSQLLRYVYSLYELTLTNS